MDKHFESVYQIAKSNIAKITEEPKKLQDPKKSHKKFIKNMVAGIILVICIILNVVLLASDIYKGTYYGSYESNNQKSNLYELTIYDNTFTLIEIRNGETVSRLYGFYAVDTVPNGEQKFAILQYSNTSIQNSSYEIKSVFVLKASDTLNLYCYWAIFCQVLYGMLILSSLLYLIISNRKFIKGIFLE